MCAVSSGWQHVVQYLLQRGADTSLVDQRHTTALMQACSLGLPTIVRLLLDSGAGVNNVCMVSIYHRTRDCANIIRQIKYQSDCNHTVCTT